LNGIEINLNSICKIFKVDNSATSSLKDLGFLTKIGVQRYNFNDQGKTTEQIADELFNMINNRRKTLLDKKRVNQREYDEYKSLKVTKKPLQPLINKIIEITKIGSRYGVSDTQMNDFVNDVMKIK